MFLNGTFHGLYTVNFSKDEYLFNIKKNQTNRDALIYANQWGDSTRLQTHIPYNISYPWELVWSSTADSGVEGNAWISDSFNKMIDFLADASDEEFVNNISNYVNIYRAIDSMLLTIATNASDNYSKNILWVKQDGKQWIPSVYDLDSTFGLRWDGVLAIGSDAYLAKTENVLWSRLYDNFYEEIVARWGVLRNGPLSIFNIDKRFVDFHNMIPANFYNLEHKKWTNIPSATSNNIAQITKWTIEHLHNLDQAFGVLIDEPTPFNIQLNTDEGLSVKSYLTKDFSRVSFEESYAFSRDKNTGYLSTKKGDYFFEINLDESLEIDNIIVTGNYGKLLNPNETNTNNIYRLSEIDSDVVITITTKQKTIF